MIALRRPPRRRHSPGITAADPDLAPGDLVRCDWPGRALHGRLGRVELVGGYGDDRVGVTWGWDGEAIYVAVPRRRLRPARGGRR